MDNNRRELEQQVWQRVRSCREEAPQKDLQQLQREAMELAAVYQQLTSQLQGRPRELARQLYLGEKANAQTLAGIAVLSRQGGENMKLWQSEKEMPEKALARCYHRTRRCMTEYMARSAEGEYGIVFRQLADREEAHCTQIAQLLGSLV